MTTGRPTGPDPSRNATDLGNGGNLPNSDDPSRVGGGFPTGAVDALRRAAEDKYSGGEIVEVTETDLRAVLAWIARYVPRAFACDVGHEVEVGGVGILTIGSDEPFADAVELIRFNGRTFVEEAATVAEPGREAAIMALWSHLPANTSLGVKATRATYEAALDAIIAALGRDEEALSPRMAVDAAGDHEAANRERAGGCGTINQDDFHPRQLHRPGSTNRD